VFRNRDRFIKIVVWAVVIAMLFTIAASLVSVLA
jgi:hypothetical protein